MVDLDGRRVADMKRAGRCGEPEQPIAEMRLDLDAPLDSGIDAQRLVDDALLRRARCVDQEDEIRRAAE